MQELPSIVALGTVVPSQRFILYPCCVAPHTSCLQPSSHTQPTTLSSTAHSHLVTGIAPATVLVHRATMVKNDESANALSSPVVHVPSAEPKEDAPMPTHPLQEVVAFELDLEIIPPDNTVEIETPADIPVSSVGTVNNDSSSDVKQHDPCNTAPDAELIESLSLISSASTITLNDSASAIVKPRDPAKYSSCHQCKARISNDQALYQCRTRRKSRHRGKNLIPCRKQYCLRCLQKYHDPKVIRDDDEHSLPACPSCQRRCKCSLCTFSSANQHAPPNFDSLDTLLHATTTASSMKDPLMAKVISDHPLPATLVGLEPAPDDAIVISRNREIEHLSHSEISSPDASLSIPTPIADFMGVNDVGTPHSMPAFAESFPADPPCIVPVEQVSSPTANFYLNQILTPYNFSGSPLSAHDIQQWIEAQPEAIDSIFHTWCYGEKGKSRRRYGIPHHEFARAISLAIDTNARRTITRGVLITGVANAHYAPSGDRAIFDTVPNDPLVTERPLYVPECSSMLQRQERVERLRRQKKRKEYSLSRLTRALPLRTSSNSTAPSSDEEEDDDEVIWLPPPPAKRIVYIEVE